jgi:hypothetical protein
MSLDLEIARPASAATLPASESQATSIGNSVYDNGKIREVNEDEGNYCVSLTQGLQKLRPGRADFGAADLSKAAQRMAGVGADAPMIISMLRCAVIAWGELARAKYDDSHITRIAHYGIENPIQSVASDGTDLISTGIQALDLVSAVDLCRTFTSYRPALIHGLLREQETMNVIAAPKVGKSWLVLLMAFCLANGRLFLGHQCTRVPVLILDNELHPETAAQRLKAVSSALNCATDGIHVISLRGQLESLPVLEPRLIAAAKSVGAKVIVLDALYRLLPIDTSENDNSGMMQLYNCLDRIANLSGAAVVCIHHSSKGSQAEKSVTDGGSGAGSISRAADTHVFLRPHVTEGHVVFEAVARSWPPPVPCVVKREGDLWELVPDANPALVKGRRLAESPGVNVDSVIALVPDVPSHWKDIAADAKDRLRLSQERVRQLLAQAVRDGALYKSTGARNSICYSRQPVVDSGATSERVLAYNKEHPGATTRQIAEALKTTGRTVQRARKGRCDILGDNPTDNLGDNPRVVGDDIPKAALKGAARGGRRLSAEPGGGCRPSNGKELSFTKHGGCDSTIPDESMTDRFDDIS